MIEECERLSKSLGFRLDAAPFMLDRPYNLVVSTPGAKDVLTRDREFAAFKGFPVTVTTKEPFKNKLVFEGNLHDRSEEAVRINVKGRIVSIPRPLVRHMWWSIALSSLTDQVLEVKIVNDFTPLS
uniref:Uncharacterized protein n=1 Tax=Guillardia theta (strain CCMP2712) TaxID=905079 RepID=A0A0C3UCY6_GUITC